METRRVVLVVVLTVIMFLSFSLTLLPVLATRGAYPGINGKVVFWAVAANLINNRIFVMNLDGTDLKQLPPPPLEPSVLPDEDPVWSPDGSKIAFYNDWPAIYVMNADGSNQIPLLKGGPDFADPAWSRDGSKIAFAISGDGIYVINTDGSGKRQVTDYFDLSPHWSPDGTKIVLQRVLDGTDSIVVVDATTGDYVGKHPLATGEGPCWSPDGSKMLFVRIENGLGRIWVMNHDGSNPTSLTPPDLDAHHPDWQRLSPAAVGGEVVIADAFSILLPCIAVIGLIGCITIVVLVPKKRRL